MNEYPHLITIETAGRTPDGSGGYTKGWTILKDAYAHVQPLTGDNLYKAQQFESKVNYKVFMEYDPSINSEMRIKYGNKTLMIDSPPINQGGLDEILVLMCVGS